MEDKCVSCPSISSPDGLIVPGPGGVPRADSAGSSSSEGPFAKEAPQTGHLIIMGTLGADGSPGSLPDVPKVGWAYVVEDPGTYGGVSATEGDIVYCMSLNPVKWGVLQADSDDSGRDVIGVSAELECSGWTAAADADSWYVVGYAYGSYQEHGPASFEFSDGLLTTVWNLFDGAEEMFADFFIGGSEYTIRIDLRSAASGDPAALPPGAEWRCDGPLPVKFVLDSVSSDSLSETVAFRVETRASSALSVSETLADGTVRTSSSDASCIDSAAVSVKADASCAGVIVPSRAVELRGEQHYGQTRSVFYSEWIDARSGSISLSGAHVDWAMRSFSSASTIMLRFNLANGDVSGACHYFEPYDTFVKFFTGERPVGTSVVLEPNLSGQSPQYSLILAERAELTSEDEGGPDILVRFQVVKNGGPSVAVVTETLGGDVSVGTADLSCLNDRLVSVAASFSCDADSYEPDYCGFFGYDHAGDSLTPLPDVSYSLSGNTLSFSWLDDSYSHAVIVFDSIFRADISIFNASEGDSFDAYSENPSVSAHMLLDSVSRSGSADSFVFRLTVGQPNPVLSLASAKADGTSSSQAVDMSCLPHVFATVAETEALFD